MMRSIFQTNPQSGSKPGTARGSYGISGEKQVVKSNSGVTESKQDNKTFNPIAQMTSFFPFGAKKSGSHRNLIEKEEEKVEKSDSMSSKKEDEMIKRHAAKLKQIEEDYEKNFSLKTVKVHFMF